MVSFRFYLITDHQHSRHKPPDVLPGLAEAGLRALQVREKTLSPAGLAAYAENLIQTLGPRRREVALYLNGQYLNDRYLNGRLDIALSLGFDGVHLRSGSLPPGRHAGALREALPKTLPGTLRFGVSTHSLEEVRAAADWGAEFATFGPVFATPSKAAYGDPVGLKAMEEAARELKASGCSLPLIALGGITPERVEECVAAGAAGVAAISAVWNAEHPIRALERFRDALGGL
ncbi:MAG: thiamine phosphate synthase [bacterium]